MTDDIKRTVKGVARRLPGDAFKILVMLLFAFPFYWMIVSSFKTYGEAIQTPPTLWPQNFTLDNFVRIAESEVNIKQYAINSIVITASIIVMQLAVMIPAAYAFAKREFPLRGFFFGFVLIAFMIPGQITYISTYLMMARAKLIPSLWPQILPFGANAFGIFMLRQAFKQIPEEIVESARLDNASDVQIVLQIMLPMSKSAMVTIAMFSFISHWNEYFWPLVMTNNEKFRPLTMYVQKMRDVEFGIQWNSIMASNMILVVPVVIIFLFASKKIIESFAYRGVK
ncbi:MAG: carbohydrate ABC transporter permease [Christensenellales bacterium]|jgi:sn-glycerol 3-phosphate transport system permease protein